MSTRAIAKASEDLTPGIRGKLLPGKRNEKLLPRKMLSQYFNSTKAASKEDTSTVPAADAQVGPIDAQVGPADEYISPQVSAAVGTEDDGPLSESEEFLDDFRFGFEVAEMTRDALISALEAVSGMIGHTGRATGQDTQKGPFRVRVIPA